MNIYAYMSYGDPGELADYIEGDGGPSIPDAALRGALANALRHIDDLWRWRQGAARMMDPRTGLLPGQSWNVTPGPTWQARIGRDGRAHCIGRGLAEHADYGLRYVDYGMWPNYSRMIGPPSNKQYRRPWHTFERACRAARCHERIVIAARHQERGGE